MAEVIKIALVASVGLGDALMFLVLAENLRRNGFAVTLYSNPGSQLASWLPEIPVKPYPEVAACEAEFQPYALVIADRISILGKPYQDAAKLGLSQKYLYLSLGKTPSELIFDHTERLRQTLPPEVFEQCRRLAGSSGSIRFHGGDRTRTMVQCVLGFCREVWGMEKVTAATGLTPPPERNLQHRRYERRILLHPFSSDDKKNWPLTKFLKLAQLLQSDGWEPVFSVSPAEMSKLRQIVPETFSAPVFPSIADLAAFIYESRAMIANDSGPGHLASALGVTTLTISRKGDDHRWRPDFTPGGVVCPWFHCKLGKTIFWKPFLAPRQVAAALHRLLAGQS